MQETIAFNVELQNLEDINPYNISRFKVYIAYPDDPANKFIFSREILLGMNNSIKGCPVLAYYSKDDNKFLGHEDDLVATGRGYKRTPTLLPIGFCDYLSEPQFEEHKGKQFLTAITYLWSKRFPEIKTASVTNQSMEVQVDYNTDVDGMKVVTKAVITGLALIGITPGFKDSEFVKCSKEDFTQDVEAFKQQLNQFKQSDNKIHRNKKYNKYTVHKQGEAIAMSIDNELGKSPPIKINDNMVDHSSLIDEGSNIVPKKEGSKKMKDFKALYSAMKTNGSAFSFDDSIDSDSDQMTILIDSEAGCMYIMDDCGCVTKIPFMTTDDDNDTFALKEDEKETMPNPKEMMGKMSQMFAVEKEKVTAEMSAQLSAKEVEMSEALLSKDAELSAKDTEIGKSFSTITSMESAMAEKETVMSERDAEVAELSKQLKGKEVAEKMSQIDEFLGAKEFSVFSAEEKLAFKDKSVEMSLDEFKDMTYSVFGKKVKDKIDFSSNTQKFSFMHVDNEKPLTSQEDKDVYAEIREKNNNK